MLERKKIKSRNHGVLESRSFLVRYRRTHVLNNYKYYVSLYSWQSTKSRENLLRIFSFQSQAMTWIFINKGTTANVPILGQVYRTLQPMYLNWDKSTRHYSKCMWIGTSLQSICLNWDKLTIRSTINLPKLRQAYQKKYSQCTQIGMSVHKTTANVFKFG